MDVLECVGHNVMKVVQTALKLAYSIEFSNPDVSRESLLTSKNTYGELAGIPFIEVDPKLGRKEKSPLHGAGARTLPAAAW